jgi:hypothetical protein
MDELIEEHREGRKTVARLVAAKEQYLKGDTSAVATVVECLQWLTGFTRTHRQGGQGLFYPILAYFSDAEQKAMLDEFYEFDGRWSMKVQTRWWMPSKRRSRTCKEMTAMMISDSLYKQVLDELSDGSTFWKETDHYLLERGAERITGYTSDQVWDRVAGTTS